eukprot:TRINITY_DN8241_c0_g1_i1.p1 TRINITY_DN8241_c0_g1~~TRINITY_DN8241_c0_g1_i1.p1  ORF type:complete len:453 (-),score=119.58 TRINITY_DN8241_c0_g1_i1:70-1428(-)
MIGSLLWNHWFWITLFTASRCNCDSLIIQPYDVPAPLLQSFGTDDLLREEGQGETDDAGEPFIASDGGRNVVVSKSVSVSRVSVEIGGVRVAKKIADSGVKFQTNETSDNDNENIQSNKSVKPQSFFQKLISQLKSIAAVKSGETGEDSNQKENNPESSAKDEYSGLFSDGEEYQLVYRDEDYVGDDQYVIDEYLNYNYNYADDISDTYSDIINISDYMQGDYQDAQNDFIDYNDNTEGDKNEKFAPVIDNQSNAPFDNLVTVNHEPDIVRPSLVSSRSDQARGRSLILQEADIKHLSEEIFEASDDVLKSEHIVLVKDTEEIPHDINEEDNLKTDFVIDFSSSKPTLGLNIKIGIFVGVALGVLIITVVAVLVMRRKVRSAKLVIDEDESTTDSQFAFSRGLKNNSSVMQEHFNNNFGKSSYTCDDLHSLDNDSFLTSLETISVKDKFTWD